MLVAWAEGNKFPPNAGVYRGGERPVPTVLPSEAEAYLFCASKADYAGKCGQAQTSAIVCGAVTGCRQCHRFCCFSRESPWVWPLGWLLGGGASPPPSSPGSSISERWIGNTHNQNQAINVNKTLVLRPVRSSKFLPLLTGAAIALSGSAAMAQETAPPIVAEAAAKITALSTYAGTLGTALLGVVAVIAVITMAIKFLRRG